MAEISPKRPVRLKINSVPICGTLIATISNRCVGATLRSLAPSVRIHLDEKGMRLLDLVDEEIVVTGAVQADRNGDRLLGVKNYELFDNNPDDFGEEPEDDYDDYEEFRGYEDFRDDDDDRPWRRGTGTDV